MTKVEAVVIAAIMAWGAFCAWTLHIHGLR